MITHVEVSFSSPGNLEFTDADYQFFGNGDIEQGKRNVDAAIQRLSAAVDRLVTDGQ